MSIQSRRRLTTYFFRLCLVNQSLSLTRYVSTKCYQNKTTSEVFKEQEDEKKRKYQQRVLDVEMGSFTPLVFGTNGGMGNECQRFLKHLADKIA